MSYRLIKLPDLCGRTGCGVTDTYESIKVGTLPPPIKKGRSSFWPEAEVDAVIAARIAGANDNQIRQLVRQLVAERANLMPPLAAAAHA